MPVSFDVLCNEIKRSGAEHRAGEEDALTELKHRRRTTGTAGGPRPAHLAADDAEGVVARPAHPIPVRCGGPGLCLSRKGVWR
jgi:hypothetical protein